MKKLHNCIGGKFSDATSGRTLEDFNPATGKVYALVPDSDETDIKAAVAAAEKAFPSWAGATAVERAAKLRSIAELIDERSGELAAAESADTGKPLQLAKTVDIPRSALNFRFFADAITQVSNESYATDDLALNYTLRRPLGVVACISPWNLPLYLLSWKVAPALSMGNCVVAKPSELTPVTAYLLSKLCDEAGLPPGVLNVVHGTGAKAGAALVRHEGVKAVSFTGSTRTGAEISSIAAPQFKKVALEMGGKNPTLVFADCDFDEAVATASRAALLNQGQICLCGSRILVERKIYKRFRDALVRRVRKLTVGDPAGRADQGAVVSAAHLEKIDSYVRLARELGGKILCGGGRAAVNGKNKDGWFYRPTVIEGLPNSSQVNQDEIFGPVAALIPFEDEKEAVRLANESRYGLSASVWTKDLKRGHRVAARLEAGVVWVNCWMLRDLRTPFGGVKQSGVGREGGLEALRFFSEPKNVCVKL